ncbi:MAG: hypothetical protein PHO92_05790, partial [Candidatus Peribacteraceae bacterium]|nr:hypothetical protein [Candidatus Peribacteraceae bacterium]
AAQPAAPVPAQPEEDEAATPPAAEPQPQPARQSLWKRWFGRRQRAEEPFVPISTPQVKLTRPGFRRIKKGRQIIGAAGKHGLKLFGISTEETPSPKPKEEAPAPAKPEPEKKEKKEEAEEKPKKKAA